MTCHCSLGRDRCNCGLADYQPAGRPLVPGQNCTPHADKDLRWLSWFFTAVIVAGGVAAIFWPGV